MATMPGLPMLGHGQIEGFVEKYGMDFNKPRFEEDPDEDLVDMVFLLHTCPFGRLTETLAEVEQLDCVNRAPVVFRIETL
jgi:hypothetical protein